MVKDIINNKKVAYYPGCFTNYYYPEVGKAVVKVLHKNEVELTVPDQGCCALPMMAKGNIKGAYNGIRDNIRILSRLVSKGYAIITTCTSCDLMIKRDYPLLVESEEARLVSENIFLATEYLHGLNDTGRLSTDFLPINQSVFYFTPCHLRAQKIENPTVSMLRLIPGITIAYISNECCGQSGAYGYEKTNYALSKEIANKVFRDIRETPTDRIVTDCGGCKLQIESVTGAKVDHPLILIQEAYQLS
ncbi:heterodisulfide reductase-related iron-sulfur binding cluster [Chloroflexota bacterium]